MVGTADTTVPIQLGMYIELELLKLVNIQAVSLVLGE